jgi:hypothetical protein
MTHGVVSRIVKILLLLHFFLGINTVFSAQLPDDPPEVPAMGPSLVFPDKANIIDASGFGVIKYSAVASAIGMSQSNPIVGDTHKFLDISNAQVILQKDSGALQFYLQTGFYSTPSLGTSYQRSYVQTKDSFGIFPLAYLSVPLGEGFKLSAGKLNSFGGYENTFSYQNINIDRGLLWNQTSNVSKGLELLYEDKQLTAAVTWNDGFYSNQLSWMGASLGYQLNQSSTVNLSWTGSIKPNALNNFVTPVAQNNSQIFNAIYTYKTDNWFFAPNLQYTYVPSNSAIGILSSAQTIGASVLANYRMINSGNSGGAVSLPFRFEYISANGRGNSDSPNLLYGAGSSAWSATVTPTYQWKQLFVRAELSYVKLINMVSGLGFGQSTNVDNQTRLMFETGILY